MARHVEISTVTLNGSLIGRPSSIEIFFPVGLSTGAGNPVVLPVMIS